MGEKHIQRKNELSSLELSMVDEGPKQQYVETRTTNFHNYNLINSQIENTGKSLVALQPTSQLHSVVYPILEANPSTPFNLLIRFKQRQVMGNEMNL